MSEVHRGTVLYDAAKANKLSIVEITKRAGYDQSMFYRHIKDKNLRFDILKKYALAMEYYFENEIPEFADYLRKHNSIEPKAKNEIEELLSKIDYWKDQAFSASKKLNDILEENIKMQKEIADLRREVEQTSRKKPDK